MTTLPQSRARSYTLSAACSRVPGDPTSDYLWRKHRVRVSAKTLRNQIHNGRLLAVKLGRDWFVTETELDRYARESAGKPGRRRDGANEL